MTAILIETLPFFALIALGYGAGKTGIFSEDATAHLTKFVFYFALSAMLFRFTANLSLVEIFDSRFVLAYLLATVVIYLLATLVALARKRPAAEAAFEAQCAVIGNLGFLGLPMLAILLGPGSIAPIILMLSVDLIVFSSLIVIIVVASRGGGLSPALFGTVGAGLLRNPMIMSIGLGLIWSGLSLPIPGPVNDFLEILGAAATPGALFAVGASLASKTAERLQIAVWLSFAKLILHPVAVAVSALMIFAIDPYKAGVMIAGAALPVAGNVYILAAHYKVAPHRVSAAILISTLVSVLTVTAWVAWVRGV